jgi:ABC-type Fe3+-hydroxamate transport system substrate-binding protein
MSGFAGVQQGAVQHVDQSVNQSVTQSALTDAMGQQHTAVDPTHSPRIVSLVPSVTELVCELGLADFLVGRTGFCIHPQAALAAVPKVGGTKDVNIDKIRALAPTHLVVNIDENEKPTVDALARFIPHVIVTHPLAPEDNPGLYRLIGGIFNVSEKAEQLCNDFAREYQSTLALAQGRSSRPPRVLYCIWKDPWMTVSRDTYIARMLALVGWQQCEIDSDKRYPEFRWDPALLDGVDEVLLSTEPYRFTEAHADALEKQLGKPVRLVDGEYLSWYGSRAVAGLAYLRTLSLR